MSYFQCTIVKVARVVEASSPARYMLFACDTAQQAKLVFGGHFRDRAQRARERPGTKQWKRSLKDCSGVTLLSVQYPCRYYDNSQSASDKSKGGLGTSAGQDRGLHQNALLSLCNLHAEFGHTRSAIQVTMARYCRQASFPQSVSRLIACMCAVVDRYPSAQSGCNLFVIRCVAE